MTLFDPGKYKPNSERPQVLDFWSHVVLEATRASDDSASLQRQLRYVLDRSTWSATEIEPGNKTKFLAQRFLSDRVKERYERALSAGRVSAGTLVKDLRHDHVYQRSLVVRELLDATTKDEVYGLLDKCIACIIHNDEHLALNQAKHLNGWDRYKAANIRVWDRATQRYL